MDATKLLVMARERITEPEHWTQGAWYIDQCGKRTPFHKDAYAYCALGALHAGEADDEICEQAYYYLLCAVYDVGIELPDLVTITGFNDAACTTHADVLALYDRAIEMSRHEHDGRSHSSACEG